MKDHRVVHVLHNGVTLCRKPGTPAEWEAGHSWAPLGYIDRDAVTCPECRAVESEMLKAKRE